MNNAVRILILEDDARDAVLIKDELQRSGLEFRSKRVETRNDFITSLERESPDLILSDHGLPAFDGFSALHLAKQKAPDVPFIFVTGSLGEETAVKALKTGATDYVLKHKLVDLGPSVHRALREAAERARRKQAEEALRESQERFRLLLEGVKDYAICMLDPEGRVLTWNTAAQAIEGYGPDQIIGRHFSYIFSAADRKSGLPKKCLAVAEKSGRFETEVLLVRKDGSKYWANVVLTALRNGNGEITGFSKVIRDITERKHAEEEIRTLNAELEDRVFQRTMELEAANKELEAFSYSVSHDLRAPLRHIDGFAEMLTRSGARDLNEDNQRLLKVISDSARQMGQLIDDLLAFSRTGRSELKLVSIPMTPFVATTIQELAPEIRNRKVTWKIAKLPTVQADPVTLRQVMVNLLCNALKYSSKRPESRVEIGFKDGRQETTFFVRDNGVGFDPRYASKLFGVFQRLHSATEFEGTGIGLAIVRRIIARHGGKTWAEGVLDEGATFYFSLPKVKAMTVADSPGD
jgi:PAS domain S-box-containing protein